MNMEAMAISKTALDVEWRRLETIAQNLANENTTSTGGGAYRPVRLVSGPEGDFSAAIERGEALTRPFGVRVLGIEPLSTTPRRVQDPSHPHADADGFVSYPDLDRAAEMTLLVKTSRIYDANLTAMTIAQQMYMRALDLGRG